MAHCKYVGVAACALQIAIASPVYAQNDATQVATQEDQEDTIVVTARRREENLQDVPISIAAIGGQELTKRAIFTENDLQSAVPGLVIRQNGGSSAFNYVIRGQSVDTFTNSPPAILPYINEVQIVNHSSTPFYDMAGIQVLKGPQGTLFGRNATGGAVLYTTAQPTDVTEGYALVRYGNHDKFDLEGALNLPASDRLAFRVAFSHSSGGDYVDDYFSDREYGGLNRTSVRGSIKVSPGAGITNTTVVQHTKEHGTNAPYALWSVYGCGQTNNGTPLDTTSGCDLSRATNPGFAAFLAANPNVYQGDIGDAVALQRSLGPWKSLSNSPNTHRGKSDWFINTTEIELSSATKIKNIFGYNKSRSRDDFDYDGSPYPYFEIWGDLRPDGKINVLKNFELLTRQVSNEIQIQGDALNDRLSYVLGVYYLDQRFEVESNNSSWTFRFPGGPFRFAYTARIDTKSVAGFGQASYKLTDRLNLTGGLRYTWDKTTISQLPGSIFGNADPEKQKASKPSWTISLDYKVTPDLLVYAAQRGSWRSGSYNYSTAPVNEVAADGGNKFLPETTYDVELGVKYSGDGLGVPVTLNADVYQQWVKNIQRAVYINQGGVVSLLTGNVPQAKISGVEVDLSVRPMHNLSFGVSANYTNARYTKDTVVLGYTTPPSSVRYGPFADVPKWSGTIFGEYTMPLGSETGDLTLRVDAYAQSRQFFSNVADTTNPDTILPSYKLVKARVTWSDVMATPLDLSVFATNLFNEEYYAGGNAGQSGGLPNTVNPGLPRFWGVEAKVGF